MIALLLLLLSPDDPSLYSAPVPYKSSFALYEVGRVAEGEQCLKIEFEGRFWKSESYLDGVRKKDVRKLEGELNEKDYELLSENVREIIGEKNDYQPEPKGEEYLLWIVAFNNSTYFYGHKELVSADKRLMRDKIKEYTIVAYDNEVVSKWEEAWKQAKAGKPVIYRLKQVTIGAKGDFDIVMVDEGKSRFIAQAINDESTKTINLANVLKLMEKPPSNKAYIEVRQKFHLDVGEVLIP